MDRTMARGQGRMDRGIRGVGAATLAVFWLVAAGPACAESHEHDHSGHAGQGTVVQVVTTNIQGKNVFIPSTIAIKAGEEVTLSIFNTTDTPHGFRIAELGIETLLMPGEETEVKLPKVSEEGLHRIDCQLHPAHRRATLLVVD